MFLEKGNYSSLFLFFQCILELKTNPLINFWTKLPLAIGPGIKICGPS